MPDMYILISWKLLFYLSWNYLMFELKYWMSKFSQIFLNNVEKIFWQSRLKYGNQKSNIILGYKILFLFSVPIIHFPKYCPY